MVKNLQKNAKAFLILVGEDSHLEDIKTPNGRPDNVTLKLRTPLRWSEADRPARTTINTQEILELDLLRTKPRNIPDNETPSERVVQVPAEDKPVPQALSEDDRFETPHFSQESSSGTVHPMLHRMDWTIDQFSNVNWQRAEIVVTADNAKPLRIELKFEVKENRLIISEAGTCSPT